MVVIQFTVLYHTTKTADFPKQTTVHTCTQTQSTLRNNNNSLLSSDPTEPERTQHLATIHTTIKFVGVQY